MASSSSSKRKRNYDVFLSFRGIDVRNNFLSHLYTALDQSGFFTYIDSEELRKGEQISPALMKAIEESEVRGGRESYRRAMVEHESKFGKDSEKVERWKTALLDAGRLSGWDLNNGDEAEVIKRIVKEISRQLDRTPLQVAKHPVGIHARVLKLESMLNLESDDDVLMIGLWGPGGIGKTTLAKAIYNVIFRQFKGSCFLANKKGLSVFSVDGGINLIQDRLCHKKVLLVLDDVNDIKQLNALAGECKWFGKGSRIIITTRDNHVLTSHGIDKDHIYEVKSLEDCEALELFNKHAFLRSNKMVIRGDLVDSALHYANGFPLALEVLGTFLCGRTECERESALNKLAKSPDKTINDVLKISYDGLEDYAKEIFLDIACFFKGRHTKYIMKVLDSCDFDTTIGVQVLVEKSLIIEENGTLHMHDLIQLMGMDIVKQECRDDPGRRSRLWLFDDVQDVLSRDRVRSTTIEIDFTLLFSEPEEIYMGPNAFANMRRLRVLIMNNVHNSFQGLICLPNELRWFEWPECPPWIPEFSSGPKKLVGLDLHKSNIQIVKEQFKDFKKLKFIYFSECQSLVCMPDLYCTPNLEVLDLHGCKNLKHGHESVAYHGKLQLLNLSGCSELRHLSDVLQAKNLQFLYLHDCSKLQTFPDILVEIKGIRELDMVGTSIKELPASIKNLVSVEEMNLMDNKELAVLLSSIYSLQNLKTLTLAGCSKLVKFPNKEDSRNNFTNLPTCGQLYKLLSLDFSHAQPLKEIFKFPENLRHVFHLDAADLSSCHELVPSGFTMNDLFKPE
ncbi:hypothetical protein EUGRSUZ_H01621, partial [Eucalyptus grandis]